MLLVRDNASLIDGKKTVEFQLSQQQNRKI